ncbi:hypothetical protein V8E36_001030 [Tilletia maclaganii]
MQERKRQARGASPDSKVTASQSLDAGSGPTLSKSSDRTLLATPSTGTVVRSGIRRQGADDESGDVFGCFPEEEWLALVTSAPIAGTPTMSSLLGTAGRPDDVPIPLPLNAGPWPVMATALGSKGLYAWLSACIKDDSDSNEHLIPFGSSTSERGAPSPPRLTPACRTSLISSPPRPAYMKGRKERQQAAEALSAEELDLKLTATEEDKHILADNLEIEPLHFDGEDAEDRIMNLLED